ncbi:hypothetical protein ACH0B6_00960 [Solibacillus silvestris]
MKKIYLVVLAFFIMYLVYLNSTAENIIYMDQMRIAGLLEKYYSGVLTFSDLWSSQLGHRYLGYHLLFILNAEIFNLNTLVELNLAACLLLFISILIVKSVYKSTNLIEQSKSNGKYLEVVSLILIVSIMFSLHNWELSLLGLGLNEVIPQSLFMIIVYILNDLLINKSINPIRKILLFLSLNLAVVFFSLGVNAPFIVGIYVITLIDFIVKKNEIKSKLKILVALSINLIIVCSMYLYNLNEDAFAGQQISLIEKINFLLNDPFKVFVFYLIGLSGSIIGSETSTLILNNITIGVIGGVIFLFYIVAVYLFFNKRLFNLTYLPLFLIIYSLLYMGLVSISRYDYGILYGLQSRYARSLMLGVIGIIWIMMLSIKVSTNSSRLKIINSFLIAFILLGLIITNGDEINKSSDREAYYQNMRTIAFYSEIEKVDVFQSPPELTIKAFEILKDNNLNVFHDYPKKELGKLGTDINNSIILSEIYKESSGNYWFGENSKLQMKSGTLGSVKIKGYMNDIYDKNKISIFVNGEKKLEKEIVPGEFEIEFEAEPNKILNFEFEIEKIFIPSELSESKDSRKLGVLITSFDCN